MSEFDDIIHLSRPCSKKHPPMPLINRAAQFGAFRALDGYHDSIEEEARITDSRMEISPAKAEEINRQLTLANEIISSKPKVSVTYFLPDDKKDGGSYVTYTGNLRLCDSLQKFLIFTDGKKIHFSAISDFRIKDL